MRRRPRLWPTGTYTEWRWPPGSYDGFAWDVTPMTDPTPDGYFWSHQFWLVGGEAGYVGLQTLGTEPVGKIAIFSIWHAVGGGGPEYAAPFTGEGEGFSVRIRFPWAVGTRYRLAVAGEHGRWVATVDDQMIGAITVPPSWGALRDMSLMWTERYAGPLSVCEDMQISTVMFSTPVADDAGPRSHRNYLWDPVGCPGSSVTDVPGGVVQRMGRPA